MTKTVEVFQEHFKDIIKKVQRFAIFVRGIEFQKASIDQLKELLDECVVNKKRAIAEGSEDDANAFLAFEFIAKSHIEEFRFYIALKEDDPDKAWDHLINAQSHSACAMHSHDVASYLNDYIDQLYGLEQWFFPQQFFLSSSFIVKKSFCSICGAEYGECDHIKGKPYMGEYCIRIMKELALDSVAIVSDPADKRCRIKSFSDDKLERNVFTWREVKKEEAKQTPLNNTPKDGD